MRYLISIKKTATSINTVDGDFVKILKLKKCFFLILFFCIFVFFASAAPQRPTCSYHANPAGSPTRNDMSLQVGEMPDWNPGLQVLQSGALPLSHHIPQRKVDPRMQSRDQRVLRYNVVLSQ